MFNSKELKLIKQWAQEMVEDSSSWPEDYGPEEQKLTEQIIGKINEYEEIPEGEIWDCPYCEQEVIKNEKYL